MENYYTSVNANEVDPNLANIIAMNSYESQEDETEDYDLDYDPNDFYYELHGRS